MRPHEIGQSCHKTIILNGIATLPGAAVVVRSSGGAVVVGVGVVECSSGGAAVVIGAAVLICPSGGAVVAVGTAVLLCPSGGAVVVVDSLNDETPATVVGDFTLEEAVETLADADASCSPLVIVGEATGGTGDCGGAEDIVTDSDAVSIDSDACVMVETSIPCVLGTGFGGFVVVVVEVVVVVVVVVLGVVVVGFVVVVGVFVVVGVVVFVDTVADAPIDPGFFW